MEIIERVIVDLPHNGVRLPYAVQTAYRYNSKRIRVCESLFTAFTSGECGSTRRYRWEVTYVSNIASARKIARELGVAGEVETCVKGYAYGIRW